MFNTLGQRMMTRLYLKEVLLQEESEFERDDRRASSQHGSIDADTSVGTLEMSIQVRPYRSSQHPKTQTAEAAKARSSHSIGGICHRHLRSRVDDVSFLWPDPANTY